MVSLDPVQGREQHGSRPVLIISADQINERNRIAVVLPITSGGNFARSAGLSVSLMGAGTATTGVVLCDQPRTIDLVARNARRIEALPRPFVDEVLQKFIALFD